MIRHAANILGRSLVARLGLIAAVAVSLAGCSGWAHDHPEDAAALADSFRSVADSAGRIGGAAAATALVAAVPVAAPVAAPVANSVAAGTNALTEQILTWLGLGTVGVGGLAAARKLGQSEGRHVGWDEANAAKSGGVKPDA